MKEKLPLPSHVSEETRRLNPAIYAPGTPAKGAQVQVACNAYPPKKAPKARQPNKTERRFLDICEARKKRGEIIGYHFEAITFRLAPDCRYTPDAMIIEGHESILFAEVKGPHIREDSRVKFLVAKEMFPCFSWEMWQYAKGEWRQIL